MNEAAAAVLTLYVVYFNPSDYRGQHVVRRQFVEHGSDEPTADPRVWFEGLIGGTLAAARESLPPGLTRMPRDPNDDPSIVELWL